MGTSSRGITSPIVIVGAGGAGMIAALRASDLGVEVLLLEKSIRRRSNSELSGGLVQAAGTRFQAALHIEDSPQQMMADIMRKNGGRSDPAIVGAICERSRDVVHFLADEIGLDLHLDTNVLHFGHSAHRMHATPSETGAEIVTGLRQAANRQPRVTLVDEIQVVGLIEDEGNVVGVEVAQGAQETIRARCVLLACDGFAGNRDMLRTFCPEIAEAVYIGSENNTGDGIRWGAGLGAALDLMSAYQGHSHVNPTYGTRLGGSLPSLGSVMVNLAGNRFDREDQGYSEFARVVLAQPGGVAIEIFDQRIFDIAWHAGAFREAFEAGAVRKASSPEDLAREFELPADSLRREIEDYNNAIRSRCDRLGRREFGKPLVPPLYGSLITGAIAHTQGGLRIDSTCRVLRPDRSRIRGLFAAGGTAAGISGADATGYLSGNGLIQALATGMIAGEAMVDECSPQEW